MTKPAILALDLGTTSCKAAVVAATGQMLAVAATEYATYWPKPGWAEQDATDWWAAAVAAGREALAASAIIGGNGIDIVGIGLSSQRETVVLTDADGNPLTRAIVWMDRRSEPQAAALAAEFGEDAVQQRTGMRCETTFTATKLRWLRDNAAGELAKARWALQPKDYLLMRLTGRPATDPSLASRTLLWLGETGGWWDELLGWAGIRPEQLPPVKASAAVAGHLSAEAATALGLRAGLPVATGAGDRACEALGVGVGASDGERSAPQAMVSLGTAVNVSVALSNWPQTPVPGVVCSTHAVPGQWLAEQGISTGGTVLRWWRDVTGGAGDEGYEALGEAAAAVAPGAGGLVLLPFFQGARATRWNGQARGVLAGLTLRHGTGEVARAIMEGVASEVRACLDVADPGRRVERLAVIGGGARSQLWPALVANVSGRAAVRPDKTEAASLGAALLAAEAVGVVPRAAEAATAWNDAAGVILPDPALTAYYDRFADVYNKLYSAVEPLFGDLAALTKEGERFA